MRIILHMGFSKTGTTALQRTLKDNRKKLIGHGVLVPATNSQHYQHILCMAFATEQDVPGHVSIWDSDPDGLMPTYKRFVAAMDTEIAKYKPEVLVISSETFTYPGYANSPAKGLKALFGPRSSHITPVIYVREPASRFLSALQEGIKFSAAFHGPDAIEARGPILDAVATFGDAVKVLPYGPSFYPNADVIEDFRARFLSEHVPQGSLVAQRVNESLSAEAMIIQQELRAKLAPGRDGQVEDLTMASLQQLRKYDSLGYEKPRLRDEVALAVQRASRDYVWLRDSFGITFPELDYDRIDGAPVPAGIVNRALQDLLVFDRDRLDWLRAKVIAAMPAGYQRPGSLRRYSAAIRGALSRAFSGRRF